MPDQTDFAKFTSFANVCLLSMAINCQFLMFLDEHYKYEDIMFFQYVNLIYQHA